MFFLYEKYDPAYHNHGQIMTKRIIPGAYLWPVLILTLVPIILGITLHWGWFFVLIPSVLLFLPGYFMALDFSDFHGGKRQWRLFNRGRMNVWVGRDVPEAKRNGEYRNKLIEYLDALRESEGSSEEVQRYLLKLYNAEEQYWAEVNNFVKKPDRISNVIDEGIIDRIQIETEQLREVAH